jgi:hypothetical protein
LAELEHDQWIEWAKNIIKSENISADRVERWKALFIPYSELSEEMKDLDRDWAKKALDIINGTK